MNHDKPDPLLEFRHLGEIPDALKSRATEGSAMSEAAEQLRKLSEDDDRILHELPEAEMASAIRRKLDAAKRAPTPSHASIGWRIAAVSAFALVAFAMISLPSWWNRSADPVASDSGVERLIAPNAPVTLVEPSSPVEPVEPLRAHTPAERGRDQPNTPEERIAFAPSSDDGVRTKGGVPRLRVHLVDVRQMSATSLRDGDSVAAEAVLQVSLLAGPSMWASVVSIDPSGNITRHLPEQGDSSILVEGAIQAPHSFQLDPTPGYERFVLLRSDRPFAISDAGPTLLGSGTGRHPVIAQSIRLVKLEKHP